jgi:hypothetical protein
VSDDDENVIDTFQCGARNGASKRPFSNRARAPTFTCILPLGLWVFCCNTLLLFHLSLPISNGADPDRAARNIFISRRRLPASLFA